MPDSRGGADFQLIPAFRWGDGAPRAANKKLSHGMWLEVGITLKTKSLSNFSLFANFAGGGISHTPLHSEGQQRLGRRRMGRRIMGRAQPAALGTCVHSCLHQPEGGGCQADEAEACRGLEAGEEQQPGWQWSRDSGRAEGWRDCDRVCQVWRSTRWVSFVCLFDIFCLFGHLLKETPVLKMYSLTICVSYNCDN